jgi:polyisoprenoid-binding protein YceI
MENAMKMRLAMFAILGAVVVSAQAADQYTIDPDTSVAQFEITRIGFSRQTGRFKKTGGHVVLDLASHTGKVDFTVETASIDMGSPAWTRHLSDEGLFNVKKFPTIDFVSDHLVFEGDKVVSAEGQFTLLGITRPLKVAVSNFQCGVNPADKRKLCSGNITALLKRSDFGLTKYIPEVSDEVKISVPVDAYKD